MLQFSKAQVLGRKSLWLRQYQQPWAIRLLVNLRNRKGCKGRHLAQRHILVTMVPDKWMVLNPCSSLRLLNARHLDPVPLVHRHKLLR